MEKVTMDQVTKDKLRENLLTLRKRCYKIKFDLDGSDYEPIENIGSGAYGVVCSALHKKTKEKTAIKKIPSIFDHPDIAKRTYREVKIIKHFKHDNIISIREILKPKADDFRDIYIVFEFMESDLHHVIHSHQPLTEEHVRFFLYQILRGLKYIHSANVIHRDLKPSNLLVNGNCELKIGDFGMARGFLSTPDQKDNTLTAYVATRWYRAPELILPVVEYSAAVDLWSVGCIFAEMLGRKQLFPGLNPRDQLEKIVGILGPPTNDYLSIVMNVERFHDMVQSWKPHKPVEFKTLYPSASKKAIDLLSKMLIFDPRERISAERALTHLFVNKYHDPSDEPICIPVFNFDFEQKNLKGAEVKKEIMKEVMDYHKPRPIFDLSLFNLKPVSKEELQKSTAVEKPRSPEQHSQPATVGFGAFLAQASMAGGSTMIKQGQEKAGTEPSIVVTTDAAVTESDIEMLSARSAKLSLGGPESESSLLTVRAQPDAGTDVIMLSAKNEPPSSVDMKSANNEQQPLFDVKTETTVKSEVKQEPPESQKPVDTKALIKEAILKAGLRKQHQQLSDQPKPRPITAYQKQKEREEKRKQKRDKAKERKKKKDNKDTLGPEQLLTAADRSMLERWKNMQNKAAPFVHPISKLLPNNGAVSQSSNGTATPGDDNKQNELYQNVQKTTMRSLFNESSNNATEALPVSLSCFTDSPDSSQDSFDAILGQGQTVNLSQPQATSVSSMLPTDMTVVSFAVNNQAENLVPDDRLGASIQPQESVGQSEGHSQLTPDFDQLADASPLPFSGYTALSPTQLLGLPADKTSADRSQMVVTTAQFASHVPSTDSLFSSSRIIGQDPNNQTVTSAAPMDAHLQQNVGYMMNIVNDTTNRDSESLLPGVKLDQGHTMPMVAASEDTHQALPSYNEAMEARLTTSMQAQNIGQDSLTKFTLPDPAPLPSSGNNGQAIDVVMPAVGVGGDNSNQSLNDTQSLLNRELVSPHLSSDWLNVLTNQMSRSHVEDLTLPRTPKGAGGGYGVGLDIDAIIHEMMTDTKLSEKDSPGPDSGQQLSASVFADWFDPNDLEALKQELNMGSPLTFTDIQE